ncbi:MAG: SDR family NAD(P)-dependent oxidoreductase [Firmicutes bacterium]|nr:SDR family NAD(P)-dependent oxidoreductase [Bacillota bacterium]
MSNVEKKKIAVITGASSGMGREFVYAIDQELELDEIWVIARREERLAELKGQCIATVRPLALDLMERHSFGVYKNLLAEEQPQIQVLVNAAGCGLFGTFMDMDMDAQLDIIDLNDRALTAFCHMSVPYMPEGSSIINLASNSSWQPVPYINVYGASKAFVMSFSRALGVELASRGIHVMAVAPGWIKTEFFDHAVHDDTIKYYDRFYTAEQVIEKAMKDLRRRKAVSILGFPVRMQVRAIKHLPVSLVMKIWCRQQGK